MGKHAKSQKQKHWKSMKLKLKKDEVGDVNDMDDEIDAFHKKRDMIPLDFDDDSGESDEDDEQAVFSYEGIDGDDSDEDDDDAELEKEEEGDDEEEDYHDKGLAAKIIRQQKYLMEKTGGVDDEFLDDAEEDEKGKVWSKGKNVYYGAEDEDKLQSSDEDIPAEEEEKVIRLQKERAQSMTAEDFGLQMDGDVRDGEPTMEEMMVKGRKKSSDSDVVPMYEQVKKDLGAMSKDEQMDAVYRSAPELAGLHNELNDAVNVLETQVNPLLGKVIKGEPVRKKERIILR